MQKHTSLTALPTNPLKGHISPFHLVPASPWPALVSFCALGMVLGIVVLFQTHSYVLLSLSSLGTLSVSFMWWRDVNRESHIEGEHGDTVQFGMRHAIVLFIISEIMFFASFFWMYFNTGLESMETTSPTWPPQAVKGIPALSAPLLNTIVLLMSGTVATWIHMALPVRCRTGSSLAFIGTIFLGVWFAWVQNTEYGLAGFSKDASAYGSSFFVATGFHGAHVMIGATFLIACFLRGRLIQFTNIHHFGFEAAAWYWHFVDVVWLFLFVAVYTYST